MICDVRNDIRIPNPEDMCGIIIAREVYVEIFSVSFRKHADIKRFAISLIDNVVVKEIQLSIPIEKRCGEGNQEHQDAERDDGLLDVSLETIVEHRSEDDRERWDKARGIEERLHRAHHCLCIGSKIVRCPVREHIEAKNSRAYDPYSRQRISDRQQNLFRHGHMLPSFLISQLSYNCGCPHSND